MEKCYIAPTTMGRFAIASAENPDLAWSGSRWVPARHGLPAGPVQVSNFPSKLAAFKEADRIGFEVLLIGFRIKRESIICFKCGMTSWSPDDVKHKYCGNCHAYHDEPEWKKEVGEVTDDGTHQWTNLGPVKKP